VKIVVDGDPVAWERMGVNFNARRIYDQQKKIRDYFRDVIRFQIDDHPLKGPVSARCIFYVRRMKSDKSVAPAKKEYGDLDNLAKFIFDCCNGIAYEDDGQIVHVEAEKIFANDVGAEPHTSIFLD